MLRMGRMFRRCLKQWMALRSYWRGARTVITMACVALCECAPAFARALVVTPADLRAIAERADRRSAALARTMLPAASRVAVERAAPSRVVALAQRRASGGCAGRSVATGRRRVVRKLGGTVAS